MDKAASLGYLGEKVLDRYMKDPPKIDISSVDSVNDFISGAPAGFSNQQLLMAPLLTAGAGGLYGYLASSPQNRKRNAIVGALGGGLIGGGASLGYKLFNGLHTGKVRKHYTLSDDIMQQQRDNLKLLEEQHKSWNPFKGELIETTTGRPIAKTELPHRIEEAKKLLELWPQIPDAAEKYQRSRSGVSMGVTGGGVGLALAKILDESVPSKPEAKQINKSKKDKKTMNAKTQKKADALSAMAGGIGGGVAGALPGAGAGGLYGLLSGAYQAEKGKKLQGALRGAGRGIVGGGLIGGGIGAGAGAGAGLMLPNGAAQAFFNPMLAPVAAGKMMLDPVGTASRSALGFVGGGALGGYLGNKARKSTLGEPKKDEEKSEEKSEKKDNKPEEKEERKAAAFLAALKEAELKLSPLAGINKPPKDKTKTLTDALEKARKAREEKEKTMPQQNKAAADDWKGFDYSNVGPGGLISWKTLPKSDATARNWQASAAQPETPAMKPIPAQQTQLPMRAVEPAMKAIPQTSNAAPSAAPAATPAAEPAAQSRRFASPLTLERVLPGQRFAPMRKAVENATGGFFGDGPQVQKGAADKQKPKVISFQGEKTPAGWKNLSTAQKAYYAFTKKPLPQQNKAANDLLAQLAAGSKTAPYSLAQQKQPAQPANGLQSAMNFANRNFVRPMMNAGRQVGQAVDQTMNPRRPTSPFHGMMPQQQQAPQPSPMAPAPMTQKASAYEFGKMVKSALGLQEIGNYVKDTWNSPGVQSFVNDPTTQAGLTYGGIGAGLGGLYGLINPGEYEDEMGNVRRRGRFSGALRGALGGGAIGGLAGAGAQEGRFQYLKHLMRGQNNEDSVALPHVDRATAQGMAEQFAQNNPDAVGMLGTSPLQSASNAYSVASNAVKGFMPKRMGSAPSTGVQTPVKPPEVKTTDEQP